jgi:hypothetical protein
MNGFWLLVLPAFVVAACGQRADATMSDYVQDLGRHMELLQAEETSHASAMNSLATIDVMQGAEPAHWERIEEHLDGMSLVMGDMTGCADERGARIDTAGFADSMQKMRSECTEHRRAMQGAADVATARKEEGRHARAVADRMMVMLDQWDLMRIGSRGYACSQCAHCGM